jgi:hypothetical protein
MDFISGQMVTGERFRALTVVDVFTSECLAIKPGKSLGAAGVVSVLSGIVSKRGAPSRVDCDKGSEFAGRLVDLRTTPIRSRWNFQGRANRLTMHSLNPSMAHSEMIA